MVALHQRVKDFVLRWWFLASSLALAVMVFLLDSKGKKVAQLNDEVQLLRMGDKLDELKEKAGQSEQAFQDSLRAYDDLKRRHPELYDRAAKVPGTPAPPQA